MLPTHPANRRHASAYASACALAGLLAVNVAAQPTPEASSAEPSGTRPCVLLRNGNVLFGEARQRGEWVAVVRDDGTELRLAADQVLCWSDSPRNLFRYRLDHRRAGDPAVHLEDARWCLRYGLLEFAARELRTVYRLDPDHPVAPILERKLRAALRHAVEPSPADDPSDAGVKQVGHAAVVADDAGSPSGVVQAGRSLEKPDTDALSLRQFTKSVQPLLINRCGGCHSHDSARDWTLIVPPAGSRPSARMARENLKATSRFVTPGDPEASRLVELATRAHGGGPAPLGIGDETMIEALKQWVRGRSRSAPAGASPAPPSNAAAGAVGGLPAAARGAAVVTPASAVQTPAGKLRASPDVPSLAAPPEASRTPGKPARLPRVENPFDPDLFNRKFHRD